MATTNASSGSRRTGPAGEASPRWRRTALRSVVAVGRAVLSWTEPRLAARSILVGGHDRAGGLNEAEVTALATVFATPVAATVLLRRAGIAPERFPAFVPGLTAESFWSMVAVELAHGRCPGGRGQLLSAAAAEYPGNPAFS